MHKVISFAGLSAEFLDLIKERSKSTKYLNHKIKKINKELEELIIRSNSYEFIKKENQRLRELLDYSTLPDYKIYATEILIKDPDNYFSDIILDSGEKNGISRDLPVITVYDGKTVLIGRVNEVWADFSKIVSITSSKFKSSVFIGNDIPAILSGTDSWELKLDYISPEAEISVGDPVYTSGRGGIFPAGIYIGSISNIETNDSYLSKIAYVRTDIYPQQVKSVFVIKKQ